MKERIISMAQSEGRHSIREDYKINFKTKYNKYGQKMVLERGVVVNRKTKKVNQGRG